MLQLRLVSVGDEVMAALGNDVRRGILRLLAERPLPAGEIAKHFPISRPAVSKHLKLLFDATLVGHQTVGTSRIYHLEKRGFSVGREWLDQFWPQALSRFQMVAENTFETKRDA